MSGARDIAICSSSQTGKFFLLTVQSIQSVQADVAGPYRSYDDMASDDMAKSSWLLKVNDVSTRGSFLVNDWVPRGPIMGCHVAPRNWLIGCV
jgi:hypothetical protein